MGRKRTSLASIILLSILTGVTVLVVLVVLYYEDGVQISRPEVIKTLSVPLAGEGAQSAEITVLPRWLLSLLAGFVVLQVLPLLMAASRARRERMTQRDFKTVAFLCETPVYLGLLGSLLGVAITQFVSGSLAAPLAYLTTISGILLYLFAKFTIWLPMYETRRAEAKTPNYKKHPVPVHE